MSRWCDRCNMLIDFIKENGKWIPLDADPKSKNYGLDHRKVCKLNEVYVAKRKKLLGIKNDSRIQIGLNEYI